MTIDLQPVAFPNEPHFERLIQHCLESPDQVALYDDAMGIVASYEQLLRDIEATRRSLVNSLPQSIVDIKQGIMSKDQTLFVAILAPGNYEFLVAALAVLATGAALVPFVQTILPKDAVQLLQICQSSCLLASPSLLELAADIQQYQQFQGQSVTVLPIQTGLPSMISPLPFLCESAVIAHSRPCLVLFTSGTTGPPKAVVIPRILLDQPKMLKKNVVTLFCRPPNHMGACRTILSTVFQGGTLDVIPRDGAMLWERIRRWEATILSAPPPIWQLMMDFFQNHIVNLPTDEQDKYICGAHSIHFPGIYGAVASPLLLDFWRDLGRPLISVYGCTETGGRVFMSTDKTDPYLKACIGRPLTGVTARLSDGDEGELLIKSPAMFTHFLGNEAATQNAFTDDGFYKTGDLVRRVGDDYVILGRVATDFIRYYGHRIPILELESYLAEVPSIVEAHVVSVPDPYTMARVGLLVRFDPSAHGSKKSFDLGFVRAHLADKLADYKIPTLMRILKEHDSVVRTQTGKLVRNKTSQKFFPVAEDFSLPPEIEVCYDIPKDRNFKPTAIGKA